jgi:outer membrane receptor protein involved in Fe transport
LGSTSLLPKAIGTVSVTYFQTRLEDLIAGMPTPAGFRFANLQSAEINGVEVGMQARLSYGLSVSGAYTYLKSEILRGGGIVSDPEGAPLVRQPTHSGSVSLVHTWNRVQSSLTGTFIGPSEDYDPRNVPATRARLPGYVRVDAATSVLLIKDRWRIKELSAFGWARNLLNAQYQEVLGFSAPGFTCLFGLTGSF